jgi:hypothetical protein
MADVCRGEEQGLLDGYVRWLSERNARFCRRRLVATMSSKGRRAMISQRSSLVFNNTACGASWELGGVVVVELRGSLEDRDGLRLEMGTGFFHHH